MRNRLLSNRVLVIVAVGLLACCFAGLATVFRFFPPGMWIPPFGTPVPLGGTNAPEGTPLPTRTGGEFQMDVTLSEGQSQPEQVQGMPQATGQALSPEEVEQILSRLPTLQPGEGDQVAFNRPAESLKPPQPGETVKVAFPPFDSAPTPSGESAAEPLKVLRYAPEGEIPLAPFISVTFNQPMVPLGTLEDLAKQAIPVKVEPELPGTWRWLGTKTLTFEYDSELIDRLPKATKYTVTVPAGVKAMSGAALAQAVTWTFTTPPPKVVATYPYDAPQPVEPVFFVAFDQRVDPAAVLETIEVFAGSQKVAVKLVDVAALEKDDAVRRMSESAQEGRWLAFRAEKPLPVDTRIAVTIGPGTPSAEGPLKTTEQQSFGFSTYAPLRIVRHTCGWGDRCTPLMPFYIEFNNPLDGESFQESLVSTAPEIPGASASASGNSLIVQGETRGQTAYNVTVSGKIKDVFGQELGKDATLTFRVGPSEPALTGPQQQLVTLDPAAPKPVFSVYAINYPTLDVKIYAVEPKDWAFFLEYEQNWRYNNDVKMPGKLVLDKRINTNLETDVMGQVDIDLQPYLNGKYGQLIVTVEPPAGLIESDEDRYRRMWQTVTAWVQVTQIGLDAFTDYDQIIAWATRLSDGSPLPDVRVSAGSQEATTDTNGLARMGGASSPLLLVARLGDDTAILPGSFYMGNPVNSLRWYIFDDRAMYRPGEQVHLKGWMRYIGGGRDGDVQLVGNAVRTVSYIVRDAMGNDIGNGQAEVNALGGFDFVFDLPQGANLGAAVVELTSNSGLTGNQQYHQFQIQEFRRPEFEVSARNETEGPYFSGDKATVAVEAKYYAGGGLPNADVTWLVTTTPGSYSPPKWPDFTFGTWRPWWWFYREFEYGWGPGYPDGESKTQTFTGKTDAGGTHYLELAFESQGSENPRPQSVSAQATVMDVNRQAWASSTSLLVHPADVYIGLRTPSYFVEKGTPLKVDFIVTDLDGNPVAGRPLEIRAARLDWKVIKGEWQEVEVEEQKCTMVSGNEPGSCEFGTPLGGQYRITAIVTDAKERTNQSQLTRWVSGGKHPISRKVEQEEATLIPDKESYQPGDTAKILVQSPFSPAEGLLTVSRSGILYTQRFTIEESTITLEIPIEDKHTPNLNIQVDLTGSAPRTDDQGSPLAGVPPRPAFAKGELNLNIPPTRRELTLEVLPDSARLEPGAGTGLTVRLKDSKNQPVANAELAVVVVDESVLALTNYQLADPMAIFYSQRPAMFSSAYGRSSIVLVDPMSLASAVNQQNMARDGLAGAAAAPAATQSPAMELPAMAEEKAMDDSGAQQQQPAIQVRSNFNPLATFAASVRTGADGTARVQVKLPDNLTRYRVMVVAVDGSGQKFGTGESNITARLPLMVRPSAPRFLNFGDKFELPVVLQNQTDEPMDVMVAIRATNLELATGGLRVSVPANDRVEVRFPASTQRAGTVRVQVAAVSGAYADAASFDLPVYTPSTTEAFATYGVVDEGAVAQPVMYPNGVFPQYGGLEITTSSTALQSLTDAVLYLVAYPYECSEQLASRILAVAALRDVLTAFDAEGLPSPEEMEAAVGRDIARLEGMQNYDGGFPYWKRGFDSSPFNTIHVTHALLRARQKGFDVPQGMLDNALNYLRNIEQYYPSWYSEHTRRTLSAYALFVRNLGDDRDAAKAERLLKETALENFSMEALGWLWPVIDDANQLAEIRRFVANRVVETPGAANFTTYYSDETYLLLSSDRRTDAILLDAIIEDNPQSDLIPKLVNGLLAHRKRGRWGNTQENVFVLLALDRYFNTYESETPDFVAKIWLGDTYAGSNAFRGRTTERHETLVPMEYVLNETSGGTQNLLISKEGPGRLYYRLGLRYAPTNLNLPPVDMGFVIQRTYEAVDDPEDVTRDANGVWHIKAGARVRVKIKMVADNRRYHVALVDPLPAGLEIVNPALAVSGSVPQDPNTTTSRYGWWWWGPWYEHQNMRDDRAEAFASLLWDGVYDYSYIARATTPGTFVVPPAKAEEMYSPEVFGRSASDVVVVK